MSHPETQTSPNWAPTHDHLLSFNIFETINTRQERASVRATNSYKTYLFHFSSLFSFAIYRYTSCNHCFRNACSNRIHNLRSRSGLTQGKGRFVKKQVTPSVVTDTDQLEIVLLLSQRSWASAEQITKDNSNNEPRPASHARKLYKRATEHALELMHLCSECCDRETNLEATAYHGWIEGSLHLKLNHFDAALKAFLFTWIYVLTFKSVGTFQKRQILTRYLAEINPKLRFVPPPFYAHFPIFRFLFLS